MTRLESVLAQALELSEDDREILLIHLHESLPKLKVDFWTDPAVIAELDRVHRKLTNTPRRSWSGMRQRKNLRRAT